MIMMTCCGTHGHFHMDNSRSQECHLSCELLGGIEIQELFKEALICIGTERSRVLIQAVSQMMDHRELVPSWGLQIPQSRYKSKWVPLAGKKRKAPDEPNGGCFEDSEPPQKLSAVDDEVAPFIIKDGYVVDDTDTSNDDNPVVNNPEILVQLEDVEMDDDTSPDDPCDNFYSDPRLPGQKAKRRLGSNTTLNYGSSVQERYSGGAMAATTETELEY
ncbi:unnamed protein product [Allacma fusca]|uniref:Uncharacterized protein n=1 Tax=Allacma fusca TaxID=39272 RepID=A0A8J2NUK6_9HEXA|nr:unnamed protein product [Allacma fusca]